MYAIIRTGGHQYKVAPGDYIDVEKLDAKHGATVELSEVLLVSNDSGLRIGSPLVEGAKVIATVLRQKRGEKIIVFKFKAKKRYRRKTGHRQSLTRLAIKEIAL